MDDLNTQLLDAVINNNLEKVKNLIKHGADIDIKDNEYKMTPLMYAIHFGYTDMANFFIDNNAKLDEQNTYGETALIRAVNAGNIDIVKKLIEHGADVNTKDETETTAFNYVKDIEDEKIQEDIIKLLNNAEQIRQKYLQKLNNQLFEAVQDENLEEVKNLIEQGADVNAQNSTKSTPLMIAAFLNNKKIVKFLIDKGANTSMQNEDRYTALFYAKYNKNKNIQEQIKRKRYIEIDNFDDAIEEFSENMTDKSKVTCPLD